MEQKLWIPFGIAQKKNSMGAANSTETHATTQQQQFFWKDVATPTILVHPNPLQEHVILEQSCEGVSTLRQFFSQPESAYYVQQLEQVMGKQKKIVLHNDALAERITKRLMLALTKFCKLGKKMTIYKQSTGELSKKGKKKAQRIVIYLNHVIEGGQLKYIPSKQEGSETIQPEQGMCMVMDANTSYVVESVTKGTQYVLLATITVMDSIEPNVLESCQLYMSTMEQERRGLLAKHGATKSKDLPIGTNFSDKSSFPIDLILYMLHFVNTMQTMHYASMTCRKWYHTAMNMNLWKALYLSKQHINVIPSSDYYKMCKDYAIGVACAGTPVHVVGYSHIWSGIGGTLHPYSIEGAFYIPKKHQHVRTVKYMNLGKTKNSPDDEEPLSLNSYFDNYSSDIIPLSEALQRIFNRQMKHTALYVMSKCAMFRLSILGMQEMNFMKSSCAAIVGAGLTQGVMLYSGANFTEVIALYDGRVVCYKKIQYAGAQLDRAFGTINGPHLVQPQCKACKQQYFVMPPIHEEFNTDDTTIDFEDVLTFTMQDAAMHLRAHIENVIRAFYSLFDKSSATAQFAPLMYQVVLAGGNTMLKGYAERLQQELHELFPAIKPQVIAHPDRHLFKWLGASKMAADLTKYKHLCYQHDPFCQLLADEELIYLSC